MKKMLVVTAALGLLAAPALAQQSPTGQSTGGPARYDRPESGDGAGTMKKAQKPKMMKKKAMKRPAAPKQPM